MRDTLRLRTWSGPLTIGTFAVMSLTGILLFFHLNIGLVKVAHEWLSWLFLIGAAAHLAVNWKPFLAYFRKPAGLAIIVVMFALGALSLVPGGGLSHRHPMMAVSGALEQSSLSLVAQVAKRSPQSVTADLTARGIRVQADSQTIAEIASDNHRPSMEILASILATAGGSSRGRPAH